MEYTDRELEVIKTLNPAQLELVKQFNSQQLNAFVDVIKWAKTPFGGSMGHMLVGYSGTGKTFVLRLVASVLNSGTVLTAPTNKAVKELQKLNTSLECCTIYSLLGLKMEQYEDTVKLVKADSSKVSRFKIVIIDECGMINTELYSYIKNAMQSGVKFLFVGDPKQLPPVGESISPVWNAFSSSKLFKVMRHDNQILELATHIRKAKHCSDLNIVTSFSESGEEGVWKLDSYSFVEEIKKYAASGAFNEDTKAIAWRNKTVDALNNIVRHVIYGDKIYDQKYLVGDRIVFTSPYAIDKYNTIFTDDEAVVKHIVISKHLEYDLMCYYLTIDMDKREYVVKTIHESDEKKLDVILNDLAAEARTPGNGSLWKKFWSLRNSLCNLKYSHAITAHRSQGSTFTNVFVDSTDILSNPNSKEAKKCLYVACTRPSKKLFVL